jgi:hypothetical protein
MGDKTRAHCTCCGGHKSVVGEISWLGNCRSCGQMLLAENIVGIAAKKGFAYRRQARGYLKYAQRVLLDATEGET